MENPDLGEKVICKGEFFPELGGGGRTSDSLNFNLFFLFFDYIYIYFYKRL